MSITTPTPPTTPPQPALEHRTGDGCWLVLLAAFLGWMFDGLEMGIFPLIARPALSNLLSLQGITGEAADKLSGAWMGYITALFLLGAAAGGLIFGWLGDRVGRVRAMTWSILTYSLITGLGYFAQSPWQLGAVRFVAALGMGGEWALGVALVMEVWPERFRPWLAASIGAASNVGFTLIALLGSAIPVTTSSWRWVLLAGAVPAVLTLLIRLFVPESHRWQSAVEQKAAAPIRELFTPALLRPLILGTALASIILIGTWGVVQWLPLWADQLTHGQMATAKAHTQLLCGLGAVLGGILGALLGEWMGRRPSHFLLSALSLASCAYLFHYVSAYGPSFLVLTFLVGCFTASFYGWLPLYLPELFPTRVRATGQGFAYNFGRIFAAAGSILAGQIAAFQKSGNFAPAGAAITLVYGVALVLIWLAPKTKGRPLP